MAADDKLRNLSTDELLWRAEQLAEPTNDIAQFTILVRALLVELAQRLAEAIQQKAKLERDIEAAQDDEDYWRDECSTLQDAYDNDV